MKMARLILILVLSILLLTEAANFSQEARAPFALSDPAAPIAPLLGRLNAPTENEAAVRTRLEDSFGQMPLLFVENQGQWDEQVAYAIQGSDKTLYFTPEGVTFALIAPVTEEAGEDPSERGDPLALRIDESKLAKYQRWVVKLDFVGANPNVRPVGQDKDEAVISYFKGQPDEWRTGLPTYRRLVYQNLWPGIDLVYEGTVNRLKYHFVVRPGTDPDQIRLGYRGATNVHLNNERALVVETPAGSFQDDTPIAYQEVGRNRVTVEMAYVLEAAGPDSQPYHFELGRYDPSLPLILDPVVLVYSGYIGGSSDDYGSGIAVDGSGNAYVAGTTFSNEATFPVTVGPDLSYNGGNIDAFVAKINPTGAGLVYAGYIGGSGRDVGRGIAVDGYGNAYVTGHTHSSEATFPVIVGPDLTHNGAEDAFVAKVNPSGTGLDYAGYIGRNDWEEGHGIAVDGFGNAYSTGMTFSSQATFPVTLGPDLTISGEVDAFVAKVNSTGSGLVYAGYIGGWGGEGGRGISVDGSGNAYVTGFTSSSGASFPITVGPDLTYNGGFKDAFVAKVNPTGDLLVYAGYIGGSEQDEGFGIAVDGSGNAHVTGWTRSSEATFPVTAGPDLTYNGSVDAFVAKVNPTGIGLVYAGYIGGSDSDAGLDIAVDGSGNAYVTGGTDSSEESFPVTVGPDLTWNSGDADAFVAKVNPTGAGLDYAGYIGGSNNDGGRGIAVDGSGNAYVIGSTSSNETTFPVTTGLDLTYNSGWDAFVAKVVNIPVPPATLELVGSDSGPNDTTYHFVATTAPISATIPLTYVWQATSQTPVTHTAGLTDTAGFNWGVNGAKHITVTVSNDFGAITNTHVIKLYTPAEVDLYLPVILKP